MALITKLVLESFRFAWNALKMNAFRTTLSLLGVTVGIFAIIGVFTVVDSLEKSIKDSLSFLGTGVIYVEKWPFTPDDDGVFKWWDFWRRPNPSYSEFKFLEENLKNQSAIAIFSNDGSSILKYKNNSYEESRVIGGSYQYDRLFDLTLEQGRYFTENEVLRGSNVVIVGSKVAGALFTNNEQPLGKE